jgi:hypothetical protein
VASEGGHGPGVLKYGGWSECAFLRHFCRNTPVSGQHADPMLALVDAVVGGGHFRFQRL